MKLGRKKLKSERSFILLYFRFVELAANKLWYEFVKPRQMNISLRVDAPLKKSLNSEVAKNYFKSPGHQSVDYFKGQIPFCLSRSESLARHKQISNWKVCFKEASRVSIYAIYSRVTE